ncbi:hypothetical protein BC834DRAFT_853485 [Gloeopeniophorella convolvens]|nr:hypothetical protein BC834DRAFT_853485 [Gloeopeniophorella convolvens]
MADPSILALAAELAGQPRLSDADWSKVEATAQALANSLRTKNSDTQTTLGNTQLPATLAAITEDALRGPRVPDASYLPALFETLRIGANLCVDHDENRGQLLDSGFLTALVTLLGRYVELIPSDKATGLLPLSVPHLKVVKTAIGVLLNATLGYEPVKSSLNTAETPALILKLAGAIYPAGSWATSPATHVPPEELDESWQLRSGLSSWAWRAIGELGENKENAPTVFGPDILPQLVTPIRFFTPPFQSPPQPFDQATPLRRALVSADFEAFEESCSLLETLALDDEDVRLSLARGLSFPDEHGGVRCLSEVLDFIDRGDYHPLWKDIPGDNAQRERAFDLCKAALVKSVVEIAGEEKNTDVLWDDSDEKQPGGAFVAQMVRWIKAQKGLKENARDDLLVCATLSLGNLLRHDAHSVTVLNPPASLGPDLAALLRPEADIKVKHGVIGLLRHLAYAAPARAPLGEAGIVERLVASNIFQSSSDPVEMVQVNAIGIAKHLSNGNAKNCYGLVLPAEGQDASSTGLQQILALVKRSDTTAVKSEGTRVFVNVIRTLWHEDTLDDTRRKAAMDAISSQPVALSLAQLIGRSKKYPVLINEGIVALTLLSLHSADVVIDAITTPLPQEVQAGSAPGSSRESEIGSPVVAPSRAADTLAHLLKGHSANVPDEVRANACILLGQVGREGGVGAERTPDLVKLKAELRPLLVKAANAEKESRLKAAAAGALQRWN